MAYKTGFTRSILLTEYMVENSVSHNSVILTDNVSVSIMQSGKIDLQVRLIKATCSHGAIFCLTELFRH